MPTPLMTVWVAFLCTPWIISWDTQLSCIWLHLCQILANLHVDLRMQVISWFVCTSMVARYAYSRMMINFFTISSLLKFNISKGKKPPGYITDLETHTVVVAGFWTRECTASFMLDQWQEFSSEFYSLEFCVSVILCCFDVSRTLYTWSGIPIFCSYAFRYFSWWVDINLGQTWVTPQFCVQLHISVHHHDKY